MHLDVARIAPGKREKILDDLGQAFALIVDYLQRFFIFPKVFDLPLKELLPIRRGRSPAAYAVHGKHQP